MMFSFVPSRFVLIGSVFALPFVMCAQNPLTASDILQTFPFSNHYQCERLCWFTTSCERYSFYDKNDNPATGTDNCVLHAKAEQPSGNLIDGWSTATAAKGGLPLNHGCSPRSCNDTEICMRGKHHNTHICVPYEFREFKEVNKVDWKGTACEQSSDCSESNTICSGGICKCTPGFYYSLSTKECISSCDQSDLKKTYTEYNGLSVGPSPDLTITSNTDWNLDRCMYECEKRPKCHTFQYNTNSRRRKCDLFDSAVPMASLKKTNNIVWHQKECV